MRYLLINVPQAAECSRVATVRFPAASSVFLGVWISKNTSGDSGAGGRKPSAALYIWKSARSGDTGNNGGKICIKGDGNLRGFPFVRSVCEPRLNELQLEVPL